MGLFDKITGVVGRALGLVDDLHTSDEERYELKRALLEVQVGLTSQFIEAEKAQLEAQSKTVVAEASSSHFLTAAWRPITMLTFLVLIVGAAFGFVDAANLEAVPEQMWSMLTLGISGYIGGRSLEKSVSSVVAAMKAKDVL